MREYELPATLEWARKIAAKDIAVLEGQQSYNRDAPKENVEKLQLPKEHIMKDPFVTKIREVFAKDEMSADLEFVRAMIGEKHDNVGYYSILSASPP